MDPIWKLLMISMIMYKNDEKVSWNGCENFPAAFFLDLLPVKCHLC